MISDKILDAIIKTASQSNKDYVLKELIHYFYDGCYDNDVEAHLLELMIDNTIVKHINDINLDYIKENIDKYIYNYDKYIVKDITIKSVDNISCIVEVRYNCKEKINEDRDDINFNERYVDINFITQPKVLK